MNVQLVSMSTQSCLRWISLIIGDRVEQATPRATFAAPIAMRRIRLGWSHLSSYGRQFGAPDNRHEEGDGRVLHRRSSESTMAPTMRWRPARAQRSVGRGARRPAIEPRNGNTSGCRRALNQRKATSLAAFSRAVSGPRGVGEPVHARDLFMLRTGRSHGHPPVVMEGRVVRGRPRP